MMSSFSPAIAYGGPLHEEVDVPLSLPLMLQRAAYQQQEHGLLYLLPDGSQTYLSYRQLYEDSLRLLTGLRAAGLQPQDKVILQIAEQPDYVATFWACLLGGIIAVPLPIAPSYHQPNLINARLQQVWRVCEYPLVVASASLSNPLQDFAASKNLSQFRLLSVESLRSQAQTPLDRNIACCQPTDAATILFTSGSTGAPKGVVLSHQNLLHGARALAEHLGLSKSEITFNWLPLEHLGGLVAFHLRDVYLGCQQIQTTPQMLFHTPTTWLDCLARYQVTASGGSHFLFHSIVEQHELIAQGHWDLSNLHCLLNVGEPIIPQAARKFLKLLAPFGLSPTAMYPGWGLTEGGPVTFSKLFTLETTRDNDPFVEVGPPLPGTWVRIIDERGQMVAEGVRGRIQVKGPSVTSGYYQDEELTQAVLTSDGWFDTGDLGMLNQGSLTVTGRAKDLIIVNGRNYQCQEIEAVTEEVAGVEMGYTVAFATRTATGATEALVICYHTLITEPAALREQFEQIRRHLVDVAGISPRYILPLAKEDFPRNAFGKLQRAQMRQRYEEGVFDRYLVSFQQRPTSTLQRARPEHGVAYTAPTTATERILAEIWQDIFQIDKVGIHDNFFLSGGDSLLALQMVGRAHDAGITLQPRQIFEHQTIAELLEYVNINTQILVKSEHNERIENVPFVSGQKWQLLEALNPHYFNQGDLFKVDYALDRTLLEKTVAYLMQHHDALRLRFAKDASGWHQTLVPASEIQPPVSWIDLSQMGTAEQKNALEAWSARLQTGINLFTGPVMQVAYFDLGSQEPGRLLWLFNHAIADFFSFGVLLEHFQIVYQQLAQGQPAFLPMLSTSFQQWAERVGRYVQSAEMQHELEAYWLKAPWHNVKPLPIDHPEEVGSATAASACCPGIWLDATETQHLLERARHLHIHLVDILLMATLQTFAQWTGSAWQQICMLDSGRNTPFSDINLARTVGDIASGRRLLLEYKKTGTLEQRLRSIQEQVGAIPHRGMGYEWLYYLSEHKESLKIVPQPEIKLNYLGHYNEDSVDHPFLHRSGEPFAPGRDPSEPVNPPSSIDTAALVAGNQLFLMWQYSAQLYERSTIDNLIQAFLECLRSFASSSDSPS